MSEDKKPNKLNTLFIVIGVVIVGYLIWAILYWQCHPDEAGQFGDMFGAVTSILTFLTVVLLIRSINLQSKELKNSVAALQISSKELELTRIEFEKQNETNKEQLNSNILLQQTTRLQRVETTLFNLIGLLRTPSQQRLAVVIDNIHHDIFREYRTNEATMLIKEFNRKTDKTYYHLNDSSVGFLTERYSVLDRDNIPEEFYQVVISILTYIKDSAQSPETKYKLIDIFKSLLSAEALLVILYHFQFYKGYNGRFVNPELVKFAITHNFFENINLKMFVNSSFTFLFTLERKNDLI